MGKLTTTLFLATLVFSGGCYRYVSTERTGVVRGTQVRAVLTEDGVDEVRGYFGPDVTFVEGPLIRWDREGMGLLAELYMRRPGFPATTMTDTIQLLPHHLVRVEIRELDGKRTAGFTVGVLGMMAGALIAARVFGGESDDPLEGDEPDPEAAIVIRIPFGIGFR